jgi:hypothetical protein
MFLLNESNSIIPSSNITTSSLPFVAKIVGFVVSWAASIYFLWVRQQPKNISDLPFFAQTQRISIVVTSVFLMLTWGALGTGRSLAVLITLAICLTGFGIAVYFVTAYLTMGTQEDPPVARAILLLFSFFLYTSSVSCGLTSAGVFITVLLTNPANAALGTSLAKPEEFVVTLNVVGESIVNEDKDTPYRVSSGQMNFGCEENREFHVEFNIPADAAPVGQPTTSFLNFDNAKIVQPPSTVLKAGSVSASGVLRGLDYQSFPFGIRNCPGGGHGELVLSGVYRNTVEHEQEVTRVLSNTLTSATVQPVWVTLPDLKISIIEATCRSKTHLDREWKTSVSRDHASASSGPFQIVYVPQTKQVGVSFKN